MNREQHPVTLDQVAFGKAGLAQEAFERLWRRAGARPLHFLAHRGSGGGQIARDQRQAARGGPDGNLAQDNARRVHLLAEQLLQIGARASLHPRRDFLAAQFEKERAHADHPGKRCSQSALFFSIQA